MQKTRKELIAEYKSAKTPSGLFQIRNLSNGKIFIGTAQNIPGILNSNRFQLNAGSHPNKRLQAEWRQYGADSFAFEVLDELSTIEDPHIDIKVELSELESLWLEKLKPYGERGYNEEPKGTLKQ
jgi:hypothetical protein